MVQGVARLRYGALTPLYDGRVESREVLVHWHFVSDSLALFLFYFLLLAVMATYISQDFLKIVPLLTIVFTFGRCVFSSFVHVLIRRLCVTTFILCKYDILPFSLCSIPCSVGWFTGSVCLWAAVWEVWDLVFPSSLCWSCWEPTSTLSAHHSEKGPSLMWPRPPLPHLPGRDGLGEEWR